MLKIKEYHTVNEGKNQVSNFTRDSLGVPFDGKFGTMRKEQNWVLYPEAYRQGYLCIQCDDRWGELDLSNGVLTLSATHNYPNSQALRGDILRKKAQVVKLEQNIVDQLVQAAQSPVVTSHRLDNVIRSVNATGGSMSDGVPNESLNKGMIMIKHKYEATRFGAGMGKRKDFSKCVNLGEILDVLENHKAALESKIAIMEKSGEDIKEIVATLEEFSEYTALLKQQSTKGIKNALHLKNSPEVRAAGEIEKALKDALSIIATDYKNVDDIGQLMTVIDSHYATRGTKILKVVNGNINNAIQADYRTIEDSIAAGDITEDDVLKFVSVTQVTHGVKDKGVATKVAPILERMNAMVDAANKLEEAVIDPKEFEALRDMVKKLVDDASSPKDTIKTSILSLDKETIDSVQKIESRISEDLLSNIHKLLSSITGKLVALWQKFTSAFFAIEDEALESIDMFNEVELGLALIGVTVTESYKERNTIGKQFEVLTKAVLTCCDDLVKDASLAGEFDDEVIYAEDAVANAIESFESLGKACENLKRALEHHKNEDNMNVIGILADAITQIVADDEGEPAGSDDFSSDDDEDTSVIDQVEREYSSETPEDEPEDAPNAAPNPMGMEPPEEF